MEMEDGHLSFESASVHPFNCEDIEPSTHLDCKEEFEECHSVISSDSEFEEPHCVISSDSVEEIHSHSYSVEESRSPDIVTEPSHCTNLDLPSESTDTELKSPVYCVIVIWHNYSSHNFRRDSSCQKIGPARGKETSPGSQNQRKIKEKRKPRIDRSETVLYKLKYFEHFLLIGIVYYLHCLLVLPDKLLTKPRPTYTHKVDPQPHRGPGKKYPIDTGTCITKADTQLPKKSSYQSTHNTRSHPLHQ